MGLATIRRAEFAQDATSLTAANDLAIRRALEAAGIEFIDENGGGLGPRLRKHMLGPRDKKLSAFYVAQPLSADYETRYRLSDASPDYNAPAPSSSTALRAAEKELSEGIQTIRRDAIRVFSIFVNAQSELWDLGICSSHALIRKMSPPRADLIQIWGQPPRLKKVSYRHRKAPFT